MIHRINSESTNSCTSIIQFRSSNSTKTSLLLSDATLDGRLIKVSYATKEVLESLKVTINTEQPEEVQHEERDVSIDDKSPSTVIAKILAKGYQLSDQATSEAKKLDEEWKVSSSIKHVLDDAKTSFKSFDEKYKISETAKQITDKAVDSAKELSDKLNLTGTASSFSETASSWFSTITSSITSTIDSVAEKGTEFFESNFGNVVDKLRDVTGQASDKIDIINTKANKIYESDKVSYEPIPQEDVNNEEQESNNNNNSDEVLDNAS